MFPVDSEIFGAVRQDVFDNSTQSDGPLYLMEINHVKVYLSEIFIIANYIVLFIASCFFAQPHLLQL